MKTRFLPPSVVAAAFSLFLGASGAHPAFALDLEATAVEVTQSIQNLDNEVPLVAKKKTWVRIHGRSVGASPVAGVVARIVASRLSPGPVTFLGFLDSVPSQMVGIPDRANIAHSINIELPYSWRAGTVQIVALVDFADDFDEDTEDNNNLLTTVSFESVPPIRVRAYGVDHPAGDPPTAIHYERTTSWLRRAFPTSSLLLQQQIIKTPINFSNDTCNCNRDAQENCVNFGFCANDQQRSCFADADCGCGRLNEQLLERRLFDKFKSPDYADDRRYVALVDDTNGFMRGCSPGLQAKVAAGPSGSDDFDWDFDGSYTDWYTAHELGHTYGRGHAPCCGTADPVAYPYPSCRIGDLDDAGFDTEGPASYRSFQTADVMSYCNNVWVSDFTYVGILDQLVLEAGAPPPPPPAGPGQFAIAVGKVNVTQNVASFTKLHLLPPVRAAVTAPGGDWELRFLDADGRPLSTHAFTPFELSDDHDLVPAAIGQDGHTRDVVAIFAEAIAVPDGSLASLALYHQGVLMDLRSASAQAPVVEITSPNGGEVVGRNVLVEWTGMDPDSDPLTYTVLYSHDAGSSWQVIGSDLTDTSFDADLNGLPGGADSLFRVIATDGFHSASDDSDAPFSVANAAPEVYLTAPAAAAIVAVGELALFEGQAMDPEDGELGGESLEWSSDRQGSLGTGSNLEVGEELVPGTHLVTLTATDSAGASRTASIRIVKGSAEADPCPAYPRLDCEAPTRAGLKWLDRGGMRPRRTFAFQFVGGDVDHDASVFGSPTTSTAHILCLYEAGRLRSAVPVPPSATRWQAMGERGFRFSDAGSGSVTGARLRAGTASRPRGVSVALKGSGPELPSLPDTLDLPVVAQWSSDASPVCFGAEFHPSSVRTNRPRQFQARLD